MFTFSFCANKKMIKKIVPYHIKVKIRLIGGWISDLFYGHLFCYANNRALEIDCVNSLEIVQNFRSNDTSSGKKENILLAIKCIELIQINPNEVFSFWKVVGNPIKKRGFVESRSLINGKLKLSVGGGLCQLSGLIYYISLEARLEIIERHNHSADIYTEKTRFTPLGSDAAVAYGYKDLKFRNNLAFPINFTFVLTDNTLIIKLNSKENIDTNIVEFEENILNKNEVEIVTLVNKKLINKSTYKKYINNTV
jgi:vancomycin resistance protein VanW